MNLSDAKMGFKNPLSIPWTHMALEAIFLFGAP